MSFIDTVLARNRFGIKPGLEAMRGVCAALDHPERRLRGVIHVAGTNGKGAVCAMLDAAFRAAGESAGRYTSPHLVDVNERFMFGGVPVADSALETAANFLRHRHVFERFPELTYFETLTAMAFVLYAELDPAHTVLEVGLGGRLDATNVCLPELCVITRIGLDHCDWLGDTVGKIAVEKAGIVKPGVPVVLGENAPEVRATVARIARERGAPFHYAPEMATADELPRDFALPGPFNRENGVTALAALKVLGRCGERELAGFGRVVWPGRFQRVGRFIVDGAHNPPAAQALAAALAEAGRGGKFDLIAGFCGDKDVDAVLRTLSPHLRRAWAVKTNNPRSLEAAVAADKMRAAGIAAEPAPSLAAALSRSRANDTDAIGGTVICGSLFLAGEALVLLDAFPWKRRFVPAEAVHA